MIEKFKEWAGVIALLAIILTWIIPSPDMFGATGTRFPNGLSTTSNSPASGEVETTTLTVDSTATITGAATLSSTASVAGLLTLNAGQLRSYTNSTSTTLTSGILGTADLLSYDTILMTPNTGDLTLTFAASSTMSTVVPTAGDMQKTCLYNATSTAGIDITIAAGTGIDLQVASTSVGQGTPLLTILQGQTGCLTLIRKAATAAAFDILVLFDRYVLGD